MFSLSYFYLSLLFDVLFIKFMVCPYCTVSSGQSSNPSDIWSNLLISGGVLILFLFLGIGVLTYVMHLIREK